MTNPLAYIQTDWAATLVGEYRRQRLPEAAVMKGLKIRSTLGAKAYWGGVGFTPVFYLNATNSASQNNYGKGENRSFNWNIIPSPITKCWGHMIYRPVGPGAYTDNIGGSTGVTIYNLPITSYEDASFNFDIPQANRTSGSSDLIEHKITSLFARVNYSYADKYLFTGIIRRDGSTRFGGNNKFGVFPSFSAGWNVNKESFWPASESVNLLKIRGGYGGG